MKDHEPGAGRLSERERRQMKNLLEGLRATKATRPAHEVDAELRAIRKARRSGARRHRTA